MNTPIITPAIGNAINAILFRMKPTTLAAMHADLHDDICDEFGMDLSVYIYDALAANVGEEDAFSMIDEISQ